MSGRRSSLAATVALLVALAVPGGAAHAAPAPSDVTGDGYADVVARDATGRLWLFPNNHTALPWSWTERGIVGADMNYVDLMLFADLNLDGLDDLVVREPTLQSGTLWVVQRDRGATTWTTRMWAGTGWNLAASLVAGDVNGDGRDDVVLRETDGRLYLYPHSGATDQLPFRERRQIGANWQFVTALRMADVNGDTRPDLVARDSDGFLWIYPYPTDAPALASSSDMWTFGTLDATPYPAGAGWERYDALVLADATGDGRVDAIGRDAAGVLWVYPHNGAPQGKNPWPTRVAAGDWWNQYTYLLAG